LQRELKRAKLVEKYAAKRAEIKEQMKNPDLDAQQLEELVMQVAEVAT
jgi:hypothetical protein